MKQRIEDIEYRPESGQDQADRSGPGRRGTIRDAAQSWGRTARFCLICLVQEAPALVRAAMRH